MKKFLFTGILLLSFVNITSAQWVVVDPLPQSNTLNSVVLVSPTTGWAVGDNGTILKTTDGGATWATQTSSFTGDLEGLFFIDESNGTIVGSDGILRTTDGGSTWEVSSSAVSLNSVSFSNANNGVAVGGSGQFYRTTDGGANWSRIGGFPVLSFEDIAFADANNGIIVGEHGVIYRTTNGGASWVSVSSGTGDWLFSASYAGPDTIIVVGSNSFLRSLDGGINWQISNDSDFDSFYDVSFANANIGACVGVGEDIIKTTNGAADWKWQTSGTTESLLSVSFFDENHGIAVGRNGVIVITSNGGVTAVDDEEDGIPLSFSLKQNYPNPFNPSTIIEYSVPQATNIKLEIFNTLGQKVATLLNEQISAGTHSVNFEANGLSSGIYLYKLTSENFSQSKKMILMK